MAFYIFCYEKAVLDLCFICCQRLKLKSLQLQHLFSNVAATSLCYICCKEWICKSIMKDINLKYSWIINWARAHDMNLSCYGLKSLILTFPGTADWACMLFFTSIWFTLRHTPGGFQVQLRVSDAGISTALYICCLLLPTSAALMLQFLFLNALLFSEKVPSNFHTRQRWSQCCPHGSDCSTCAGFQWCSRSTAALLFPRINLIWHSHVFFFFFAFRLSIARLQLSGQCIFHMQASRMWDTDWSALNGWQSSLWAAQMSSSCDVKEHHAIRKRSQVKACTWLMCPVSFTCILMTCIFLRT